MGESDGPSDAGAAVAIERPDIDEIETLVEMWVGLASGQRAFSSHVEAEANRAHVRDSIARHAVTGGVKIARLDGSIVGFVTFGPERGGYDLDATRGIVRNLFVRQEYRSQGIGGRLLEAAESALSDSDVTVVALETMAENDRARAFYRERGYEPHRVELEKSMASGEEIDEDTEADGEDADSADGDDAVEGDTEATGSDGKTVNEDDSTDDQ
ncbi:MAG: GNAT family N-acetyltransferase [Halobellus sp.]|uniref:GNAT family N-acetyltransferase n=1 Tax=Halobellus sp. TaxID=1979212 RepID=UPI0035D472D7